eukprot:TRINITY_DN4304_c0_g1_i3.p1 TRINITY_DN4304_c0_g1~~TRINITY_DN4304_c0_g1_i3.p1  ORF type:complete len:681 (-),score=120.09 TRINITY_DN4304_c0_g1_i3:353-2395(-)
MLEMKELKDFGVSVQDLRPSAVLQSPIPLVDQSHVAALDVSSQEQQNILVNGLNDENRIASSSSLGNHSSTGKAFKILEPYISNHTRLEELISSIDRQSRLIHKEKDAQSHDLEKEHALFFQFCFQEIMVTLQQTKGDSNATIPLKVIDQISQLFVINSNESIPRNRNVPESPTTADRTIARHPEPTAHDWKSLLKKFFPIVDWLPNYDRAHLKGDITAGITVGILLIPQGISYSLIAGLPPIHGLYTALAPLLAYTLTGTSKQIAAGPMAVVSLMITSVLSPLAEPETESYIQLAYTLSLMVGCIMVLLGLCHAGIVSQFLSQPIVSGYTSGASIIIVLGQLKYIFGIPLSSKRLHEMVYEILANIKSVDLVSLSFGVINILFLHWAKSNAYTHKIPSASLLLSVAIPISYAFDALDISLPVVKQIPAGLPALVVPSVTTNLLSQLLTPALTIAFVSYVSAITVARLYADKMNYQIVPDQEFVALGISNIVGSFFQAFPMTGGLARTAVNVDAGAKSQLAGLFTAIFIILLLAFLTPIFYYLPLSTLAAVIIYSLRNVIDFSEAKLLWKYDRHDFYVYSTAFCGTIFLGILEGIIISMVAAVAFIIYRSYDAKIQTLSRRVGSTDYIPSSDPNQESMALKYSGELNFLNFSRLRDLLRSKVGRLQHNSAPLLFQYDRSA